MKIKNLILIIALITSYSCNKSVHEKLQEKKADLQLWIGVYDISKSTDAYAMLTETHIGKIYDSIGIKGGGTFCGLLIQSNSLKQDPVIIDIPALQQLEIKGNTYQKANRKQKNKELLASFESGKKAFVAAFSQKLLQPKTQEFSDVKNALEIARKVEENPKYSTYVKSLIVISDMENDFSPLQGIDEIEPVHFDSNTRVLFVRPSDKMNLDEIVPGIKYTVLMTIDDALSLTY